MDRRRRPDGEDGLVAARGATGHGYATEAVRALSDLAFDFGVEGVVLWSGALAATGPDGLGAWPLA